MSENAEWSARTAAGAYEADQGKIVREWGRLGFRRRSEGFLETHSLVAPAAKQRRLPDPICRKADFLNPLNVPCSGVPGCVAMVPCI